MSLIGAEPSYWLTNKRKQTARLCPTYGVLIFFSDIDMLSKPLRAGAAAIGLNPLVIPAPTCNRAQFPGLVCGAGMNWIGVLARGGTFLFLRTLFASSVPDYLKWKKYWSQFSNAAILHSRFINIIFIQTSWNNGIASELSFNFQYFFLWAIKWFA